MWIIFSANILFLSYKYQRLLLNGQSSKLSQIKAGAPKDSILGHL